MSINKQVLRQKKGIIKDIKNALFYSALCRFCKTLVFSCFVVVTFMMVVFTWVFLWLNPGLKEEMAVQYRSDLQSKGNYTATEIDDMVGKAKEYFVTMLVSMAIFGYLAIGALVTVIASGFLSQKKFQTGQG